MISASHVARARRHHDDRLAQAARRGEAVRREHGLAMAQHEPGALGVGEGAGEHAAASWRPYGTGGVSALSGVTSSSPSCGSSSVNGPACPGWLWAATPHVEVARSSVFMTRPI